MLEWLRQALRAILGDSYSEDTDKKVSEEIGKGFVAKADFTAAKGKSAKAIRALLDTDALKASKNQTEDTKKALDTLREEMESMYRGARCNSPDKVSRVHPFAFRASFIACPRGLKS